MKKKLTSDQKRQNKLEEERNSGRRYVIIEGATAIRPELCFFSGNDEEGVRQWVDDAKDAKQFTSSEIDEAINELSYDEDMLIYFSKVIFIQS